MKKIKEELHLIILWNEDHLGEVEDTINYSPIITEVISVKEFSEDSIFVASFELPNLPPAFNIGPIK